jgi:DNA mismatch repair protein MutS2
MHTSALRALEFDRIVAVVAHLAITPPGRDHLAKLHPLTDATRIVTLQRETSEARRFLADHQGFPLRAPADLPAILEALGVEGRALEPLRLLGLADYLESIEATRAAVASRAEAFPILARQVSRVASFAAEIRDVRRKIEPSGEVADDASPALADLRERLRKQKRRLRTTLESLLRGRETAKYLQEQVVTDRNGRHVLVVRAEHRSAVPGIVHGGSTSGASLFVEPIDTVEINNDIVALGEREAEEVRRILLALADAFRRRAEELRDTIAAGTGLDVIQARARFSLLTGGVEPAIATDGTLDLRAARHPLLMGPVQDRLEDLAGGAVPGDRVARDVEPVPVDIHLMPPTHVLVITGPNTGGKTVALKTAGLLAAMSQAGLHVPAESGSRLPVFRSVFVDIGDEQSIAASLSTFSAHVTNLVSMDRDLDLPALVLLDEIGAGTDPVEGGALGVAAIDHFRSRGAHLIATTHYDSLKSYASTTARVESAAFGFDPETFAPTYRLIYGSPGRSLAIEIAARLGMPPAVIAAARENLGEREQQLADHLARVDDTLRKLEADRRSVAKERAETTEREIQVTAREAAVRDREQTYRRRLDARLAEDVRAGRREIDTVLDGLKARVADLEGRAASSMAPRLNTGEAGKARAEARAALDRVSRRVRTPPGQAPAPPAPEADADLPIETGARVRVGSLGLEGTVVEVRERHAEVDIRGKRMRAALGDLRVTGRAVAGKVNVSLELQPRGGSLADLNVVGCTVDEAVSRVEKFLDDSTVADQQVVRIIHGHGTGQLRRGLAEFLGTHPLVSRVAPAPADQGGSGVTVVELKD